jgi:hypothetical protein
MTEPIQDVEHVTLSSQAFLLLCRLFDRCYDELKQNESLHELVETVAHILLAGVETLEKQEIKPKTITFPLTTPQAFLLRRLVVELLAHSPAQDEKTVAWWQECMRALTFSNKGAGGENGASLA